MTEPRGSQPGVAPIITKLEDRMRKMERHDHGLEEVLAILDKLAVRAYSWQSSFTLVVGVGHSLAADRHGTIRFIRAERSAGDGSTDATFDVFLNGESLFDNGPNPIVPAGEVVGPERIPDQLAFRKEDIFLCEILDTGGGTGPLRVTIHFVEDLE